MTNKEMVAKRCLDADLSFEQLYYIVVGDYANNDNIDWFRTLSSFKFSDETMTKIIDLRYLVKEE